MAKEKQPQSNNHVAYERLDSALFKEKMNASVYTEGGAREGERMTNKGVTVVGSSFSIPRKEKIGAVATTSSAA